MVLGMIEMAVVAEEDIYHMAALVELLVGRNLLLEAVARLSSLSWD